MLGDLDQVATAVCRVTHAANEPFGFHLVEQQDRVVGVDAEDL
ncbi:MAG: hypothetical protein ACJ780_09130 [Solirubrobacteraceae bacterium]